MRPVKETVLMREYPGSPDLIRILPFGLIPWPSLMMDITGVKWLHLMGILIIHIASAC
ncbi:unnamed protein product [Gulo gulo]|uniref:Uncharacterized protein n=1 Tax=Gulo gulo TaxID=48420 RepID=A0A9X9Q0J0_GULGU|nr:unnamed protein product [Gulo gulo]